MTPAPAEAVPRALRAWFTAHFAVDWMFAIPLLFAPEKFLVLLGWRSVDPVASRLVAAALIGIGTQSLLSRGAEPETYRHLLSLKIVWSLAAVVGLVWSAMDGGPGVAWAFAALFSLFCGVWSYWRLRLK